MKFFLILMFGLTATTAKAARCQPGNILAMMLQKTNPLPDNQGITPDSGVGYSIRGLYPVQKFKTGYIIYVPDTYFGGSDSIGEYGFATAFLRSKEVLDQNEPIDGCVVVDGTFSYDGADGFKHTLRAYKKIP